MNKIPAASTVVAAYAYRIDNGIQTADWDNPAHGVEVAQTWAMDREIHVWTFGTTTFVAQFEGNGSILVLETAPAVNDEAPKTVTYHVEHELDGESGYSSETGMSLALATDHAKIVRRLGGRNVKVVPDEM